MTDASVLFPVYRGAEGDVRVALIRRSRGGSHSGHMAFPGGKHDAHDKSMLETALREAWEEVGIPASHIVILAELSPANTRNSGFRVYPFIGRIIQPVKWQRNEREVAEILDVSLVELMVIEVLEEEPVSSGAVHERQRVPYYRLGEHQVWGWTYRMVRDIGPRILSGEWQI